MTELDFNAAFNDRANQAARSFVSIWAILDVRPADNEPRLGAAAQEARAARQQE